MYAWILYSLLSKFSSNLISQKVFEFYLLTRGKYEKRHRARMNAWISEREESEMKQKVWMQVCVDPKIYSVLYPKNYALCSYHLRGARKTIIISY